MKRSAAENEAVWNKMGKVMLWKGGEIEVFTRGALAVALNRQIVTIRALEKRGVLCHPKLKNERGHWMYNADQIRDLVKLAEHHGVIDPARHEPYNVEFARAAKKILRRVPQ